MSLTYRVHNHSTQTLLVATQEGKRLRYHRLPPGCASPPGARPRFVQAFGNVRIDGALMWELTKDADVHVSESDPDSRHNSLHISGLGIEPSDDTLLRGSSEEAEPWAAEKHDLWVTVLGAGVTGLTAAHELITRGFRVQVIEKAHRSPVEVDPDAVEPGREPGHAARFRRGLDFPDVGGLARTQWTTQPLERGDAPPRSRARNVHSIAAMRSVHGDCHWEGATKIGAQACDETWAFGVEWTSKGIDPGSADRICAWLDEINRDCGRSIAAIQLVVVFYGGKGRHRVDEGYARLNEFLEYLTSPPGARLYGLLEYLEVFPTARIEVNEEPPTSAPFVGLLVRVHEDLGLVAGEHGFRFFPGFYRHLRDTMRRTPIYDPHSRTFTARTALANLVDVEWQVFADPTRPYPAKLLRRPFTSIAGLIEQYRAMRRDLDYRPADLLRFLLRLIRYMTSSTKRREAEYEDLSWLDFLTLRKLDVRGDEAPRFDFDKRFHEMLRHAPKALVAMSSEFADARTQGNIAIQLMMDEFDLHEQSDATLSGPTSVAWLSHWRTYLKHQGVQFFVGEVTDIQPGSRATVAIAFPDGKPPQDYVDAEALLRANRITAHYYLSAMDIVGLARTTRAFRSGKPRDYGVLTDLSKLIGKPGRERDLEDIAQIGRGGPFDGLDDRFQTLTGIQFYYRSQVSFEHGHIYFIDSPWGLSAVSQIQYWGSFGAGRRSRFAGNLSIDIGAWRGEARNRPDPNQLSRNRIAGEVERQILASLRAGRRSPGCVADYYHLDDHIAFTKRQDGLAVPARNHAPFLINLVGDWKNRPTGEPWAPNDVATRGRVPGRGAPIAEGIWRHESGGYLVHLDNLVIAGTHMRTFTRMGTMESANESARHAVNAILDHLTFKVPLRPRPSSEPGLGRIVRAGKKQRSSGAAASRKPPPPDPLHSGTEVDRMSTPYGEYCNIWDPERHEFPDLEFLRLIDSYLMTGPHLFDILRIDEIPDHIDGDHEALGALELLGATLAAFKDSSREDLPGVIAVIERARTRLKEILGRRKPT